MPVWVLATNLDMISCEYHMTTHPDHMTYSISRDLRCANSALPIPGRTTRERESLVEAGGWMAHSHLAGGGGGE